MTNEPKTPEERDYPQLPEPDAYQIAEIAEYEHGQTIVGWRVEGSHQSFAASMRPKRVLYASEKMRAYYELGREAGARDHESSYSSKELAAMVLSDCGHSSNYEPLLNRVAGRIDWHVERLLTAQRADLAASPTAQAAPAAVAGPAGIYVASRASLPERPAHWRALRTAGWPIVSTWIDEAGPGETDDAGELWARIAREVASAQGVVLHVEPDDFPLKGALVEVGMALSLGKRVGVYAPGVALEGRSMRPLGSWAAHPLVRITPTLQGARDWIEAAPQPPAEVQEPAASRGLRKRRSLVRGII